LEGVKCIRGADRDNDDFQFVRQKLKQVERAALFAMAPGKQVMPLTLPM
jgi:hypothetical protein